MISAVEFPGDRCRPLTQDFDRYEDESRGEKGREGRGGDLCENCSVLEGGADTSVLRDLFFSGTVRLPPHFHHHRQHPCEKGGGHP